MTPARDRSPSPPRSRDEGRSWIGRHHHVTLVTAAHTFLTE